MAAGAHPYVSFIGHAGPRLQPVVVESRIMRTLAALLVAVLSLGILVTRSPADDAKDAKEAKDAAGWRDLFNGKDLTDWRQSNFGGDPETTVEDGKIVIPMGERLSGITYTGKDVPKANYEVELEARKVDGNDFFVGLTFPVAESHASLILGGWGGSVCGISSLDDEDASDNETRKTLRFKKGQWYKVRLRVEGERIQAWLDEQPLIDVSTKGRKVGIRDEVGPSRPFGLATFATTAEIKSVRIREISDASTKGHEGTRKKD